MMSLVSRRGGTLPMVILLITVATIALAAAYTLNGVETQVGDDYEEQVAALALAESGRHRYLTDRAGLGWPDTIPAALEVDTIPYADGVAIVTLTQIRPQVQQLPPLYLLRSRGLRNPPAHGNVPAAERTISQYLYWDVAPLNVLAGWTSLTGAVKNGSNIGSIVGVDASPGTGGGCPPAMSPVAAVAVPNSPGFSGDLANLTGTPLVSYLGDANATKGSVDIDWPGIVNNTADMTYDLIIPPATLPSASYFTANPNYWPTIRVNGDLTISAYGRGTLIITGNLNMNSVSARWDGVVLVGGVMTSNGNSGVNGATVTGLNILLGQTVGASDIGNGTKSYKFNSCNVAKALKNKAKLRPLPNTWMDIATY